MKKITFYFFALCCFAFSWQGMAQSVINITTSGGSYTSEKWVSITTEVNGGGTQIWGQGNGTQCDGAGLINEDINIAPGVYYVNCYDQYDDGWDGTLISVTAYGNVIGDNGGVSPNDGEDTDASSTCEGTAEELEASFMITVPTPPCATAVVDSSTVVDDCGNSNEFSVDVVVSTVGDGTFVSDGTNTFPIVAGTVTAGPYTNGDTVTLTVEHSDPVCNFSLGDFETGCTLPGEVCENSIVVGSLPYSTTDDTSNYGDDYSSADDACSSSSYLNGDDVVYSFTPATDMSVNMTTSGTGTWVGLFVYEQCPFVTCVDSDTQSGGNPSLPEVSLVAGTTYYIVISTYPSPQSTAYTLDITENTCTAVTADFYPVNDCDTSGGFYVEVDVTDMGSATALTVSDDQGNPSQPLTAIGTLQFGPYVNGTDVVITIDDDNDDDSCTVTSSAITQSVCPPANDVASGAVILTLDEGTACGANAITGISNFSTSDSGEVAPTCTTQWSPTDGNGDLWYQFVAPASDLSLRVSNISGMTSVSGALYSGTPGSFTEVGTCGNAWPKAYTGLNVGETYYLRVWDYGNDQIGTFDLCGYYLSCTPATVAYNVISDCDNSGGFLIEADISDMGSATSLSVEDDQGNTAQVANGVTTLTFGPYVIGTDVVITATPNDNALCVVTSSTLSQATCPPANDECSGAIELTVEGEIADLPSATQIPGTIAGATDSGVADPVGTANDDVWYSFTATATDINIDVTDNFDGVVELFSGACGTLTSIEYDDFDGPSYNPSISRTDFVVGETYYLRVYYYSSGTPTSSDFTIALWTTSEVLSTQDFDKEATFTYYPNPVNNNLTLSAQKEINNVSVYNMVGQEVFRNVPNAMTEVVDMSSLQAGAYFVKVTIGNATKTVKVIKN